MISFSFRWIAFESLFCDFWIRKTIKKVIMVVPVLIINCQVSEYLNTGPVTPHIIITAIAVINAAELPVALVAQLENCSNKFFFLAIGVCFMHTQLKKSANVYHISAFVFW